MLPGSTGFLELAERLAVSSETGRSFRPLVV